MLKRGPEPTLRRRVCRDMKIIPLLLVCSSAVMAADIEIALVDYMKLDDYAEMLLMRTARGMELNQLHSEASRKDSEYSREHKVTSSPFLSEVCAANAAIACEKHVALDKYVKAVIGSKYLLVISDTTGVISKQPEVKVVDLTLEVIDAISREVAPVK